jgi:hypothetical protein
MSDIVELERGVNHARENLERTLDEFNRKATLTARELLAPEEPIRRYPLPSLCGAMALGFVAGGWRMPAMVFGVLALGGALMAQSTSENANGIQ